MPETVRRRFLDELDEPGRAALRAVATVRRAAAGDILCLEGAPQDQAFLVVHGLVAITKTALSGRQVVLELRGPGELIGEMAILDGEGRAAMMTVVEAAELLVIPAPVLADLLWTNAPMAHALLVTLVARLRQSSDRQLEMGTAEALARVARRLLELWEMRGQARRSSRRCPSRTWPTGRGCHATVSCGPSPPCGPTAWSTRVGAAS